MIVGYTTGVFDLFHVGHLNLLRNAKGMCDKLIVGVTSDDLAMYKNKKTVIPHEERMEIVGSSMYVDSVIYQEDMDKFKMWEKLKFDIMLVGCDWHGTDKWNVFGQQVGVKVVFFPYTKGTSSTILNQALIDLRS